MGVYTFDKDWVHSLGWKGTVQAKLRYAWERNSVMNWQNDEMSPCMFSLASTTGYMTWMAYDNPNYNAHMISGSIVVSW
jgi:putative beta-barrel porin MtrB/PioB